MKNLARISVPYALSAWLVALYFKVDVLFLAGHIGSAVAGIYDLIYKLTSLSLLFPAVLSRILLPKLFRSAAPGELAHAGSFVYLGYCSTVCALLILAAVPIAEFLPSDQRHTAVEVLSWLPLYLILHGAIALWAEGITSLGHQSRRAAVQIVAAIINVGLNAVLIPRYGVGGAIVATFASEAALGVGYAIVAARLGLGAAWRSLVLAGVMYTAILVPRLLGQRAVHAALVTVALTGLAMVARWWRVLGRNQGQVGYVRA